MITHLKGTVENIYDNSVVIDVNGVGYNILCSSRTANAASDISGIMHIYTVLTVREDAWTLYGFISEKERFWFNTLTSVQGVGGKAAISILSTLSDDDIYNAFISEDKSMFIRVDGIGQKIASRIISELKDKVIGKMDISMINKNHIDSSPNSQVFNDVVSALLNLGYQKMDIYKAASLVTINSDSTFEGLVKQILGRLSQGANGYVQK
jgi:Holliday junction DNA helicase RuvA